MKLKERLESWLELPGNTQTALAAETGMSQGAINNYLKGRTPKPDELWKLADFFDCTIDELLGRAGANDMVLREEPPRYGADRQGRAETAEKVLKELRGDLIAILGKIDAIPAISSTLTAKEVGDHFVRGMKDKYFPKRGSK